MLEKTCIH